MVAAVTLRCIREHWAFAVFRDGNDLSERGQELIRLNTTARLEREFGKRYWLRLVGDKDTAIRVSARVFQDCWRVQP